LPSPFQESWFFICVNSYLIQRATPDDWLKLKGKV